ncbi:hypothetical protein CAPTEDRAFT_68267, partial [Capitella teleta]
CYMTNENALSWLQARNHCLAFNADLVSITGSRDQALITELMSNSTAPAFWIGGNQMKENSGWVWSDGAPFSFFNWDEGKPDNLTGSELCIEVDRSNYAWSDQDCSNQLAFICKKPGQK